MKVTEEIKEIYTGIQHQLSNLIPEKWEGIYLYASVINQESSMETWEMYFYYIPKGIIKKNPINVYEIPSRFNFDEKQYLVMVDNLGKAIKSLHRECEKTYNKKWTNMIISIKNEQFLIEYDYSNVLQSNYTSQDRHRIFKHKYLNIPLQCFSKSERKIIKNYLNNENYEMVFDRYFEYIPNQEQRNYIEYEKDNKFEEDLYSSELIVSEDEKKDSMWKWIDFFQKKSCKV